MIYASFPGHLKASPSVILGRPMGMHLSDNWEMRDPNRARLQKLRQVEGTCRFLT